MSLEEKTSIEMFDQSQMAAKIKFYLEENQRLTVLFNVTRNISRELKLDNLLLVTMNEVKRALKADRCTIFLLDKKKNELCSKFAHGEIEIIRFPRHLGIAGYVAKSGDTLNIPDAYADPRFNREIDKKTGYHTRNMLTSPLRNKLGETIGVFQVLNKYDGSFTKDDEQLLDVISVISATQVENAQLYEEQAQLNMELAQLYNELKKMYEEQKKLFDSFIETFARTIDARDYYMAGHSHRTAKYADAIAQVMSISPKRREILWYAALIHDFGKIAIREAVLTKNGSLTDEEKAHMREHATFTRNILKTINFNNNNKLIPTIAAAHHEKMNGTGYPDGISGDDIPLEARILAVADVFDAYTSDRHHRTRMTFDEAIEILDENSGTHFDVNCVQSFKKIKLDVLIKILKYNSQMDLDEEDLKLFSKYNINQLMNVLKSNPQKGEKKLIAARFKKYYNKDSTK